MENELIENQKREHLSKNYKVKHACNAYNYENCSKFLFKKTRTLTVSTLNELLKSLTINPDLEKMCSADVEVAGMLNAALANLTMWGYWLISHHARGLVSLEAVFAARNLDVHLKVYQLHC